MIKPLDYLTDDSIEIIRQRRFDLDENDSSKDNEINEMYKDEVAACLIGWELGSDSWLSEFIEYVAEATNRSPEEITKLLFD